MNRIVKDAEVRRTEILDTAQYLYYSKGYEQTSIQSIIDEIGIAKGTFYHYFRSKQDLLDALVGRIADQTVRNLVPMIDDDRISALEKFNRFISDSVEIKFENRNVLRTFMQVYYQEDNALMRERVQIESIRRVAPLLAKIIHQGVAEGDFVVAYPEICAEIVMQTIGNMSRTVIELYLISDHNSPPVETVQNIINAHEEAITRMLDAPADSIKIIGVDLYRRWFEDHKETV
jgi:AcrR family transcriptional regulator